MSSRSFKLDMSGPGRRDTLNSRNVGRLHKWNNKESSVKMSQVERKRIGVKLDRRRLKEMLAEEPLSSEMTVQEENSLRADLHMSKRLTEQEELEEARMAWKAWEEQYWHDVNADYFLERLDQTLLSQHYDLDDDIDQRELVDFFD